MKYLKKFENINDTEPEVGDYILIKVNLQEYGKKEIINNFINNTIGKVYKIYNDDIRVSYENIPDEIKGWFSKPIYTPSLKFINAIKGVGEGEYTRLFSKDRIVVFSKNKKDVEPYIQANKYNL